MALRCGFHVNWIDADVLEAIRRLQPKGIELAGESFEHLGGIMNRLDVYQNG